jgi:Tfp pilus assembly protein PilE
VAALRAGRGEIMATRKAGTTRALFLELVLDLVIFAICATICLQVFGEAHLESVRSAALSRLGIEAQEIAESFKAGSGDKESLAARPGAQREDDTVSWYFDQDLDPVASERAYFTLSCTIDDSQPVEQAQITLREGAVELLAYDVCSYRPAGGDGS